MELNEIVDIFTDLHEQLKQKHRYDKQTTVKVSDRCHCCKKSTTVKTKLVKKAQKENQLPT